MGGVGFVPLKRAPPPQGHASNRWQAEPRVGSHTSLRRHTMYRSSSSPSRATCAASASWMRMTTTTTSRSSPVPSREVCRGRADTPNPVGEEEDMTRLEDAVWHYRPKKPFFVICLWPSVTECAILDIFCQTPCSGYFGGYSNFDQQFFGILFIPPPPADPGVSWWGG